MLCVHWRRIHKDCRWCVSASEQHMATPGWSHDAIARCTHQNSRHTIQKTAINRNLRTEHSSSLSKHSLSVLEPLPSCQAVPELLSPNSTLLSWFTLLGWVHDPTFMIFKSFMWEYMLLNFYYVSIYKIHKILGILYILITLHRH